MYFPARSLPRWFVVAFFAIMFGFVIVQTVFRIRISVVVLVLLFGLLALIATRVSTIPGRRRLAELTDGAPVFVVELDSGSASAFDPPAEQSWYFLIPAATGIELWTIDREPVFTTRLGWFAIALATVDLTGRGRRARTVAIEWPDAPGIYLDVKPDPRNWLRGGSSEARRLTESIAARLAPATPIAGHVQAPLR